MKRNLLIFIGLLASLIVVAQVNTTIFEKEGGVFENFPELLNKNNQKGVPVKTMPSFDVQKLLDEDQRMNDNLRPLRFGYGFEVSYTIIYRIELI